MSLLSFLSTPEQKVLPSYREAIRPRIAIGGTRLTYNASLSLKRPMPFSGSKPLESILGAMAG